MTEQQQTEQPTAPDAGDVKAATTKEAVLRALYEEVKEAYNDARTDVQYLLDQQERATGARQFGAFIPDGTEQGQKVATISLTGGESKAKVTDEAAFTDWCREAYPSEVQTRIVHTVQSAFVGRILDEMTAAGAPRIVDGETGELHDVPGVEIKPSRARTHSVNFSRKSKNLPGGGRELVAEAWRRGELAHLVLPALAPAETGEEGAA